VQDDTDSDGVIDDLDDDDDNDGTADTKVTIFLLWKACQLKPLALPSLADLFLSLALLSRSRGACHLPLADILRILTTTTTGYWTRTRSPRTQP
jgi:hypothetical protein